MKYLKVFLILVFFTCSAFAQSTYRLATEQEKTSFNAKLAKSMPSFTTMTCSFSQSKMISALGETVQSEGCVYFKKQDRLCWQYLKPYAYKFVINGDKIKIENGKNVTITEITANKKFAAIKKTMMAVMNGKSSQLTDFNQSVSVNDKYILISLTPKTKEMMNLMSGVKLYFEKNRAIIDKIQFVEKSGDTTTIQLKNKQVNVPIKDEVFTL